MGIQLNGITGDITTPGDIGIGGTLTYEDVANVDSIGVITARSGINVTGGNINVSSGSVTATSFSGDGANLTGVSGFSTALAIQKEHLRILYSKQQKHLQLVLVHQSD